MKTASAYKSLCQEEKQFLFDLAEKVALLVAKPETADYFCKSLTEFGEKWQVYRTAQDARRKRKWQPSMGMPDDPLATIWPRSAGAFRFPYCGGAIRGVLGAYTILAVIHDKVLPNCPRITTGTLPKELADEIWRDLVTGANNEDQLIGTPKWVIPTGKIEAFLRDVNADIEGYLAQEKRTEEESLASGGNTQDGDGAQADTPPPQRRRTEVMGSGDDLPPMPVETLEDVENVALALLHSYRRAVEWEQEARRVLDACAESPETSAGRELKTQLILDAWRRVGDLLPGNDLCKALPASESLNADAKGLLHQAQALRKYLSRTNINLSRAARRLLPDVWERLETLPVGPPAQDLDSAERDWKRLVKAAGAERARQEPKGGQVEALAAEPNAEKPLLNERRTVLMTKAEAARILTGRQSARSREVKKALARYEWRDEGDRKGTLRLDKMDTETAARFRGQDKVSHREPLGGPRKDARPAKT